MDGCSKAVSCFVQMMGVMPQQMPRTTIKMRHDSDCLPAGVLIRSVGPIKSLSFWAGDLEFFIELTESQFANLARALTDNCAVYQVSGRAKRFNLNPNTQES